MEMIFGLPGSGKTTLLTKKAIKALKKGEYKGLPVERVYTNWAVNYPGIYQLNWDKIGYEQYEKCLILIDEISLFCDNRSWKENLDKAKMAFFKLYRHYRAQIIVCSQSYDDADKKIRSLADEYYQITPCPFGFSLVRAIKREQTINGKIDDSYYLHGFGSFVFRPRYYKYFDSYSAPTLKPNTSEPWVSERPPVGRKTDANR